MHQRRWFCIRRRNLQVAAFVLLPHSLPQPKGCGYEDLTPRVIYYHPWGVKHYEGENKGFKLHNGK
jgi:hypothetical protein